jgi:hypothetical protein
MKTHKKKLILYYWHKTYFKELTEIIMDEVPKTACWLGFNSLVASSKRGYLTIDVRSKLSNSIDINDRLTFPLLSNHGNDSILCATQSGIFRTLIIEKYFYLYVLGPSL